MEERKVILRRVYIVYVLCCVFAVAILSRVFYIQFAQGDYWKKEANYFMLKEQDIDAGRGNIFAHDGSLLATSIPYYEVGIDPHANPLIDDADYADSVHALSRGLAQLLHDHTAGEYYKMIMLARDSGERYRSLARNVSDDQLKQMKTLPLFRLGQYKGGFIYQQTDRRQMPFDRLASRTIGYVRDSGRVKVGLEGAFDSVLTGIKGKRLLMRIAGGWMPADNDNEIDPVQGRDIVSTIDVNIQDVAENALMNSLIQHNAKYGCVVLMEVQTGAIRAIANLSRKDSGVYVEDFNYAIADAREPGSTFKLASLLVGMDDGLIDLNDQVNLDGGQHVYFNQVMHDAEAPKKNIVTASEAFWESSNVGISKLITQAYGKDPKKFTDGLHRLCFGQPLGLQIPGEGHSFIKHAGAHDWSSTSLPWISIGYESLITPLQTLTLYNAVANNGVMVKPMFVKEIREKGKTLKSFDTQILNPAIAKPQTIAKAKQLLVGVVQNGTARNLKNSIYPIAGKTGTAQIARRGNYKDNGQATYQASFVGYFPADNPKYSCIVVVNAPSNDVYYGALVAGPIFRQIADRVFSTQLDIHQPVNSIADAANELPVVKTGLATPTLFAAKFLQLSVNGNVSTSGNELISVQSSQSMLKAENISPEEKLAQGVMPDLSGMNGADALFILENSGYRVRLRGCGAVAKQSIAPGEKISKGSLIEIELSL